MRVGRRDHHGERDERERAPASPCDVRAAPVRSRPAPASRTAGDQQRAVEIDGEAVRREIGDDRTEPMREKQRERARTGCSRRLTRAAPSDARKSARRAIQPSSRRRPMTKTTKRTAATASPRAIQRIWLWARFTSSRSRAVSMVASQKYRPKPTAMKGMRPSTRGVQRIAQPKFVAQGVLQRDEFGVRQGPPHRDGNQPMRLVEDAARAVMDRPGPEEEHGEQEPEPVADLRQCAGKGEVREQVLRLNHAEQAGRSRRRPKSAKSGRRRAVGRAAHIFAKHARTSAPPEIKP